MKMQVNTLGWTLLLVYAIQKKVSLSSERKRMLKFTKVKTIQTVSNIGDNGKPPIATENISAISCAALLMQFGPFTCMEYYDLKTRCRSYDGVETVNTLTSKMSSGWLYYNAKQSENANLECKLDDLGRDYRGKKNTTKTGIECMVWSAKGPHTADPKILNVLSSEEGAGILNTNYCRNPDFTADGPWCYTMKFLIHRQTCKVPLCHCYT